MRGNESPVNFPLLATWIEFQIPMRGNESPVNFPLLATWIEFQIPMRGNEMQIGKIGRLQTL